MTPKPSPTTRPHGAQGEPATGLPRQSALEIGRDGGLSISQLIDVLLFAQEHRKEVRP